MKNAEKIEEWKRAHPKERVSGHVLRQIVEGFTDPTVKTDLRGADLSHANLVTIDLGEALLDGANLRGAELSYARFFSVRAENADFRNAKLEGADFQYAKINASTFKEADLTVADLRHAAMTNTDFQKANLSRSNLERATLRRSNLFAADLNRANLREVDMWGANMILSEAWGGLRIDGYSVKQITMLPTPDGWVLYMDNWIGTVEDLKSLIKGENVPTSEAERWSPHRSVLESLVPMLESHISAYAGHLDAVKDQWGNRGIVSFPYQRR